MSADAIEFDQFGIEADGCHAFRQLLLLVQWEKNIGCDANDKRALQLQALETGL